jgi:hypothetical protein
MPGIEPRLLSEKYCWVRNIEAIDKILKPGTPGRNKPTISAHKTYPRSRDHGVAAVWRRIQEL